MRRALCDAVELWPPLSRCVWRGMPQQEVLHQVWGQEGHGVKSVLLPMAARDASMRHACIVIIVY